MFLERLPWAWRSWAALGQLGILYWLLTPIDWSVFSLARLAALESAAWSGAGATIVLLFLAFLAADAYVGASSPGAAIRRWVNDADAAAAPRTGGVSRETVILLHGFGGGLIVYVVLVAGFVTPALGYADFVTFVAVVFTVSASVNLLLALWMLGPTYSVLFVANVMRAEAARRAAGLTLPGERDHSKTDADLMAEQALAAKISLESIEASVERAKLKNIYTYFEAVFNNVLYFHSVFVLYGVMALYAYDHAAGGGALLTGPDASQTEYWLYSLEVYADLLTLGFLEHFDIQLSSLTDAGAGVPFLLLTYLIKFTAGFLFVTVLLSPAAFIEELRGVAATAKDPRSSGG